MSEQNRKRSRKSKLTLRECNGVENEELNIVQILSSDDDETRKKNDVVVKEEKPVIKKEFFEADDYTFIKPMNILPAPMEFSVKVEIEKFDEDIAEIERLYNESKMKFDSVSNKDEDDEKELSIEKSYYSAMNIVDTSPVDDSLEADDPIILNPELDKPERKSRITEAMIIEEIDRIYKESTTEVDKKIYFRISRYWQRPTVSLPEDYFDSLIQECINTWKYWQKNSRGRCVPFLFKCYVCKLGWWRLFAFREHVAKHVDDLSLACEFLYNECNFIAYVGQRPKIQKVRIFDKSNCPICGQCYKAHVIDPLIKLPYICKYCSSPHTSCRVLADHQSQCYKYKTSVYNNCKLSCETYCDDYICQVCKLSCYTETLLTKHMSTHLVWSDVPIGSSLRYCGNCHTKSYAPHHICNLPRRSFTRPHCINCNLQFKRKYQYAIHIKNYKDKMRCDFCGLVLKKSCQDLLHYAMHSENYVKVYRCNHCDDVKLWSSLENSRRHLAKCHVQKKCPRSVTDVVIPKKFLDIIKLEEEDEKAKDTTIDIINLETDVAEISEKLTESDDQVKTDQLNIREVLQESEKGFVTEKLTSILKPSTESESMVNVNEEKPMKLINLQEDMDTSELDIDLPIFNPEDLNPKNPGPSKIIKICRCNFEGTVQEFEDHKTDCFHHHQEMECTKCYRFFTTLYKYINHFYTEHGLAINTCPECNQVFLNRDKLSHVNSHIKGIVRGFYIIDQRQTKKLNHCVKCNVVVEKKDLFQHWESHLTIKHEMRVKAEPLEYDNNSIYVEKPVENALDPGLLEMALDTTIDIINLETDVAEISEKLTESDDQVKTDQLNIREVLQESEKGFITEKLTSILKPSTESESMVNVNEEKPKKLINLEKAMDTSELDIDLPIFNPEDLNPKNPGPSKIIKICRCNFEGTVQEFEDHKTDCFHHHQEMECTKCYRFFTTLYKYINHFYTEHGLAINTCPECNQVFLNRDKLSHVNSHIKGIVRGFYIIDQRQTKKLNHCVKCNVVVEKKDLFQHWESHLTIKHEMRVKAEPLEYDNNSIYVEKPVENALDPGLLEMALARICIKGKISNLPCVICGRVLKRHYEWKRHIIEHLLMDAYSKSGEDGLECQLCQEKFSQAGLYKGHMREHANFPLYKCNMCNKTFSDSSNFAKHKKVHNISVLICDLCNRKFQSKKMIIKHMQIHEKSGSKFQCDKCAEIFPLEVYLRKHIYLKHSGQASRQKCCICRLNFKTTKEKSEHMWEVHKLRRYKADCPECGASFRKFTSLKQHIRKEHSGFNMSRLHLVGRNGVLEVAEVPAPQPIESLVGFFVEEKSREPIYSIIENKE